jgi:DNA-binding beta-propeller fold protein YncE
VALDGNGGVYVVDDLDGVVGKFATSGATLNSSLIRGLPNGGFASIACDGTYLYLANSYSGSIAKYTLSGTLVNKSLISESGVLALACDGNGHLFVAANNNTVGEFTTAGSAVDASLITSGLDQPFGIALDGNGHLFVSSERSGIIGEYTTTGEVINASLITGLSEPGALVVVPEPSIAGLLLAGLLGRLVCGSVGPRKPQAEPRRPGRR